MGSTAQQKRAQDGEVRGLRLGEEVLRHASAVHGRAAAGQRGSHRLVLVVLEQADAAGLPPRPVADLRRNLGKDIFAV